MKKQDNNSVPHKASREIESRNTWCPAKYGTIDHPSHDTRRTVKNYMQRWPTLVINRNYFNVSVLPEWQCILRLLCVISDYTDSISTGKFSPIKKRNRKTDHISPPRVAWQRISTYANEQPTLRFVFFTIYSEFVNIFTAGSRGALIARVAASRRCRHRRLALAVSQRGSIGRDAALIRNQFASTTGQRRKAPGSRAWCDEEPRGCPRARARTRGRASRLFFDLCGNQDPPLPRDEFPYCLYIPIYFYRRIDPA